MTSPIDEPEDRALFGACLDLTPEERRIYLDRTCRGRPALRRRVERLLGAHERMDGGAAAPPVASTIAPPPPRRRAAPILLALAVAAVAGVVAITAWQVQRARDDARRAEAVTDLLVSALTEAAPADATVAKLLRRVAGRLDLDPERSPEVRVALLSLLGQGLLAHEEGEAAERALVQAVAEAERTLGGDDRSTLHARVLLSSAYRFRGEVARLRQELEPLVPRLRAGGGELAWELAVALQNRAALDLLEARDREAEAAAGEAFRVAARRLGALHPESASAAILLARVLQRTGDVDTALARSEEASRLARDVYRGDPDHPRVLEAEMVYAAALVDADEVAEGLDRAQAAADRAARHLGPASPRTALLAGELARLRLRAGQVREAVAGSAAALPVLARRFGDGSVLYAEGLELHGAALLAARRAEEAASVLARAAEILEQALGASHERVRSVHARQALARAYRGEAEEALRRMEGEEAGAGSAGDRRQREAGHVLAVVLRLAGRPAEALSWQEQRLAAREPRLEGRLDRQAARSEVGLALLELGRYEEATTPVLRALDTAAELGNEGTPDRADLLLALGRIRLAQGRPAEALEPLEAAERFWRDWGPETRWEDEAAGWLARCRDELARRTNARRAGSSSAGVS